MAGQMSNTERKQLFFTCTDENRRKLQEMAEALDEKPTEIINRAIFWEFHHFQKSKAKQKEEGHYSKETEKTIEAAAKKWKEAYND